MGLQHVTVKSLFLQEDVVACVTPKRWGSAHMHGDVQCQCALAVKWCRAVVAFERWLSAVGLEMWCQGSTAGEDSTALRARIALLLSIMGAHVSVQATLVGETALTAATHIQPFACVRAAVHREVPPVSRHI